MSEKQRVVVLGAGPGGYAAAFHAADHGLEVTLVGQEADPGGVCLHVGCIPSKALLHVAKLLHETREASQWGVEFGQPTVTLDRLRGWKDGVVGKLTGGLSQLCRTRRVRYLRGTGRFTDARTIVVDRHEGGTETLTFDEAIIASGSRPVMPAAFPRHPRIMDSTEALALEDIPESLLIVGGGYIGLELGTVYSALGSKVIVVEALKHIASGADRDLVEVLEKRIRSTFAEVLCDTKVLALEPTDKNVRVKLTGLDLTDNERVVERVLVSIGRRPNSDTIGLDTTGVEVDEQGFIKVDERRRTSVPHLWAIGDVAGQPMLAHKASYEARVAVEAMLAKPAVYDPQAIPAVVFTDPELAWCGLTEAEAKTRGNDVKITRFPWAASGRATTLGRNDGLTKILADAQTERVLGVGIVGVGAGELIAEAVLAVEMGARTADLQLTIHAHPTLSETVMESADLFFGQSPHYYQRDRSR